MNVGVVLSEEIDFNLAYELRQFQFPRDKKNIARMSYNQKMAWYAYQFEKDPRAASIELSTLEFMQFWKWKVLIPMKIKRFFYRVKNGEVFRKYPHISVMKDKMKRYCI